MQCDVDVSNCIRRRRQVVVTYDRASQNWARLGAGARCDSLPHRDIRSWMFGWDSCERERDGR